MNDITAKAGKKASTIILLGAYKSQAFSFNYFTAAVMGSGETSRLCLCWWAWGLYIYNNYCISTLVIGPRLLSIKISLVVRNAFGS
jgi:hypothetical protein